MNTRDRFIAGTWKLHDIQTCPLEVQKIWRYSWNRIFASRLTGYRNILGVRAMTHEYSHVVNGFVWMRSELALFFDKSNRRCYGIIHTDPFPQKKIRSLDRTRPILGILNSSYSILVFLTLHVDLKYVAFFWASTQRFCAKFGGQYNWTKFTDGLYEFTRFSPLCKHWQRLNKISFPDSEKPWRI